MAKTVKSVEDDMWLELFKTNLEMEVKTHETIVEHLRLQIEFLKEMIKNKEYDEPWVIFKKKHKQWEEEVDELEKKLCDAYAEIGKEFSEQTDFYRKLKGTDKKSKKKDQD